MRAASLPRLRPTLALILVLLPAAASAQDARTLFQRGQAAYETGDYAAAIEAWDQAYALDPRPLLQYNLAQAHERLGDLPQAVAAYRRFLENAPPDGPNVPTARARLASLEQRLASTGIRLTGGVEGAVILVDGEDRGRLPRPDPLPVSAGSHRVVVRAPGHRDFVSNVVVSGGQVLDIAVEMSAEAGAEGASADASSGGGGGVSPVGIALVAAGGAALVAGAVTGGLAVSSASSAQAHDDDDARSARTLAIATDVLVPVGVAAAAVGVVLMLVLDEGGAEERAEGVRVLPWADARGGGAAVEGRF
jgi:tetratricopeptide (TPR) repeat protein